MTTRRVAIGRCGLPRVGDPLDQEYWSAWSEVAKDRLPRGCRRDEPCHLDRARRMNAADGRHQRQARRFQNGPNLVASCDDTLQTTNP
jgi:hypothetical protein